MAIYSKKILEYAFYKYVELVDFEDEVYCGWFVPNIHNEREYYLLNRNHSNTRVFLRSHIKSIRYASNGYKLPKKEVC